MTVICLVWVVDIFFVCGLFRGAGEGADLFFGGEGDAPALVGFYGFGIREESFAMVDQRFGSVGVGVWDGAREAGEMGRKEGVPVNVGTGGHILIEVWHDSLGQFWVLCMEHVHKVAAQLY